MKLAVLAAWLLLMISSARGAGNDWMTALDGQLPLSQLSIPGTHDAGARFETIPGTAKCQTLTLPEQLDAGIRFLDIRCRHTNDNFTIYHGPEYQYDDFDGVLAKVGAFLDANPGETVIMSVKEEYTASNNTRSFEATFDGYVAKNPARWLLTPGIPTLDAARGRIVLFRRFGAATAKGIDASVWPDNATFSVGGRLRVQDQYVVPDNDAKWSAILAILKEASYGGPDTMYVNFSSGYRPLAFGIPNIPMVADNINPRLAAFFDANRSGRFGVILMDFADAAKAQLIYQTNAPPGRAVSHAPYFMIINRNSGKAIDLIGGNSNNAAPVNQWSYDYGGRNQRWALAPTENADHFRLSSWVSGKCACIEGDSTAAGAKLHAFDYTGNNPAQQFDLVDAGNGYFLIRNVNSGLVLEIANAGMANNDRIQQNVANGSPNQQWRLQPWGDYFVRTSAGDYLAVAEAGSEAGDPVVRAPWDDDLWHQWRFGLGTDAALAAATRHGPGRVVAVDAASTAIGAGAVLAESGPLADRQVHIEPLTDGSFRFRFVHSGMAWDAAGAGTQLIQSPPAMEAGQLFRLERRVRPLVVAPLTLPGVSLNRSGASSALSWPTQHGYLYQPQASDALVDWENLPGGAVVGNGRAAGAADETAAARRFYRLAIVPVP